MTFSLLLLETSCQTNAFQHPAEQYLREVWPAVTKALKEAGIACELNLVRCCIIFRFGIMFCRQCQEVRQGCACGLCEVNAATLHVCARAPAPDDVQEVDGLESNS